MSNPAPGPLGLVNPVATVAILGLLLWALLIGIAPNVDTRVVQLGERTWPGYAADLRRDPAAPDCDLAALRAKADTCVDPAAPAPAVPDDPFAPAPAPAPADPFAAPDPFGAGAAPSGPSCAALRNLAKACDDRHEAHRSIVQRITPSVRRFRSVELAISDFAQFPYQKHLLVLLVLLGALSTTAHRMHIALRNADTLLEHRIVQGLQLVAHGLWLASCVSDWRIQRASSAELANPELPVLWAAGFGALGAINLFLLARPPPDVRPGATTPTRVLMAIPLYVYMAVVAGLYFALVEGHPSGMAIFLHKYVQIPSIYMGVGLYIWAGMLLSRTRVSVLAFDVLTPFALPPALLAWLVVVLSALPTAYSGASGIFVIAAGAVIFHRLREVGAPHRLALTAAAMSGSLGVVLRPCLVVVLIAVLNKQVTTDDLFGWGLRVFALTATLSLVVFLGWYRPKLTVPDLGVAVPAALRALLPLVPYAVAAVAVLLFYRIAIQTGVNEHTAPLVLPAVLLAMVAWDRLGAGRSDLAAADRGLWKALTGATGESSHHVGALLLVMGASVVLGGVVERSDVMSFVPETFGSRWLAMAVVVVVMVLVGMTMDALGATILVSVTVAPIAYANGIDPVHFWMVVLVGFELGYLTPPVALNVLLARQVVGPEAELERVDPKTAFLEKYEHWIVPCLVMGSALLLVAFVPLALY